MLGELDAIEEYNNYGGLIGLDEFDDEELLGRLRRLNPIKRRKFLQKIVPPPIPSRGSRAEMEKHFRELPRHIKRELKTSNLRLADTIAYSIKPVTSKTIKMFETQDDKQIGLRSISNAKLAKNQALLVSGIIMLAGVPSDNQPENVMAAEYGKIEDFPAIATGEFSLKANKKVIVPETNHVVFKTANMNNIPFGYYKLSNPRLIQDDVLIELTVELGSTVGLPPNTHIYMAMHGTITTP